MNSAKRNPAADIIRCLAFFTVVSVHFFLNNGFYEQTVYGKRMLTMVFMRAFFIICVPLFMTLSGFLLRNKKLSKDYYKKIGKTITTYILASIACIIYSTVFLHQSWGIKTVFAGILNFTAAPYSWYIEMYLGLFLIIPFLNIIYNHLPSQKWKLFLVLIFIILTALPSIVNVYNFDSAEWWLLPSSSSTMYKIIPEWWVSIYPITYYFIGCYLSEFGLKVKPSLNIILLFASVLLSGLYSFWRSYKSVFTWGSWCGYNSIFSVIITVLVFSLIINLNYEKFPTKLASFLKNISGLCLGGYLVSWIFDKAFYPILLEKIPLMTDRLEYYFIIVPAVFISSLILSYLLTKVQLLLENLSIFTINFLKNRKNHC